MTHDLYQIMFTTNLSQIFRPRRTTYVLQIVKIVYDTHILNFVHEMMILTKSDSVLSTS